jgi:hypothetical protein
MACSSNSTGYNLLNECPLDNTGGIVRYHIAAFSSNATFNLNSVNQVTGITSGQTFYTFDCVLETSEIKEEQKTNVQGGTQVWQQDITYVLNSPDYVKRNQVKAITSKAAHVVAEYANGSFRLCGKRQGVWPNGTTSGSGIKGEDPAQYIIKLIGKEKEESHYFSSGTISGFTTSY